MLLIDRYLEKIIYNILEFCGVTLVANLQSFQICNGYVTAST